MWIHLIKSANKGGSFSQRLLSMRRIQWKILLIRLRVEFFLHEATVEGWKINKLQTTYFTTEILYNEYELTIPYISKCLSFSIPFFVLVFIDSL